MWGRRSDHSNLYSACNPLYVTYRYVQQEQPETQQRNGFFST
jgi:hypothetical protein